MKQLRQVCFLLAASAMVLLLFNAPADAQLTFGGTTYSKFLWGTARDFGSVYNFTTVPGEGFGDNGQGSEVELLLNAKLARQVEVRARIHSRFNQNFWTNFGGFGGRNPANNPGDCIAGDCGEYDPRSNQYFKLRGVAVVLTPGYSWIDSATIGANDFGQFDPFVIGRFRYIDRDNASGYLFQGSGADRNFSYDIARIALPRLFAGPGFTTGNFHASDAAYGFQTKYKFSSVFDLAAILKYVNDIEIDETDRDLDDGREIRQRFRNTVFGLRAGIHPSSVLDVNAAFYTASSKSDPDLAPRDFFGLSGFSPVPVGNHDDQSWKVNVDVNEPFDNGLSFNFEVFDIGAEYVALLAARREADVLLTEGHDSAWAFPGPANAAFGVFAGNPTRIGYGGWDGNAQQVATINVDNEFTDFDEPMAETVIGWKGFTVTPVFGTGNLDLRGEYTYITYNTNWQAFDDLSRPVTSTVFPVHELDTGVGHNFRTAYQPFQDKTTNIGVIGAKYVVQRGRGIDIFGKFKIISEEDNRLNDPLFLPFLPGDCPGNGQPCANNRNIYGNGNSTADIYGNPPVITVNGVTGYQWKPFDSITDDDRELDYTMLQIGIGSQLTNDFYGSLAYERYNADLLDGNTAFQAYQLHELASGEHRKNKIIAKGRYVLAGTEFGIEYQYNFGTFAPDFGGGFVTQFADESTSIANHVPVGSPGFRGRFGGWNPMFEREFTQQRIKAFMKVQF